MGNNFPKQPPLVQTNSTALQMVCRMQIQIGDKVEITLEEEKFVPVLDHSLHSTEITRTGDLGDVK